MSRQSRAGAGTSVVGIRATDAERAEWSAAAKWFDSSLSDWIRGVANTAASKIRIASGNSRETAKPGRRNPRRG